MIQAVVVQGLMFDCYQRTPRPTLDDTERMIIFSKGEL